MLVLGIDPGLGGALALLDAPTDPQAEIPKLVDAVDLPTRDVRVGRRQSRVVDGLRAVQQLWEWEDFMSQRIERAFIENVHAMPGDHLPQVFAFGKAAGAVEALAHIVQADLARLDPQVWRARVGIERPEGADRAALKRASRCRACELWPSKSYLFRRVRDTDRAEAALIALAGCA